MRRLNKKMQNDNVKRLSLLLGILILLFIGFSCKDNSSEKQVEVKPKEETFNKDSGFSENAASELKLKESLYKLDVEKEQADFAWLTYKEETYIVNSSEVESTELLHFNGEILMKELHYPEVETKYEELNNGEVIVKSPFLKKNKLVLNNIRVDDDQIYMDVTYQGKTMKGLSYHSVQEEQIEKTRDDDATWLAQAIESIVLSITVITDTFSSDCKMALDICESHAGIGYVAFFENGNCKEAKCNFASQKK